MTDFFTENVLEAPVSELVCWCHGVSKQGILQAIEDGAESLEDIQRMTSACTLCRCREMSPRHRCCSKEIRLLLEDAAHKGEQI